MGQNTEMRRFRGFGDTTFAMLGGADAVTVPGAPLPEALFSLDVQGQTERIWRVQHFEATEALSSLYEVVIDVASESFTDNPDLMLGRYVVLQVQRDPTLRRFYGVVRRVEQRGTTASSRLARIFVVPSLWTLTQRSDARVFQNMNAVEVAQGVLQSAGLYAGMLQLVISRECPRREYCVQYRETDLAFFERLLESEGITYFFRHDFDGTEVLVLTDSAAAWPTLATMDGGPVPIAGPEMVTHSVETVRNLTWVREVTPARVSVRDFDFTRPNLVLEGVVPRRTAEIRALYEPAPALTINEYGGTGYTRDDAKEQAQLRFEAASVPGALGQGEGVVTGMLPGASFAVTLAGGHIPDERYLVTRVTHTGDAQEELLLASEREAQADQRYRNRFECALVETPHRPQRKTPRPVISGLQTATVTGPAGEEVYTDAHGRIRVQFHWDREGARDDRSTCWIRAMQGPWAGGGFGFQFLPRVGMEVAVSFLEGDPDRPVVIGALFNGLDVPPYELPAQRTRSGVRTQTVGGAGFNELSFEDGVGVEQVRVHAQRDLDVVVLNDRTVRVGRDHHTAVDGEVKLTAARNARAAVTNAVELTAERASISTTHDHETTVGRDQRDIVEGSRFETVNGSLRLHVEGDRAAHVGGYVTSFVGHDRDLTVQGDDLEAVWGDRTVEVKGDLRERVAGGAAREVDGDATLRARGSVTVTAGASIVLRCGESVIELTPDEIVLRAPTVRVETREALALTTKGASLELDGSKAELRATKSVEVASKALRLLAKDARASLDADGVEVSAKKSLGLAGNGATLSLDAEATVQGAKVHLKSGSERGRFKSRIGSLDPHDDVFVLATQLVSPGGVALAGELVQLIDPQTDEPFGAPIETDARGEVRVEVPHPGPWDLRLVHDDYEEPDAPHDHEVAWELHASFVTHLGAPIAGLRVKVRGATADTVVTDEGGAINMLVAPGPYTLEVDATDASEPQTFEAHATLQADRTRDDGQSYVFVIEPDDPDLQHEAREHRSSDPHDHEEEG
ncbi:MAG: type VI secretion system tip protein TssI/VgrG [Polyangiales bacterium]